MYGLRLLTSSTILSKIKSSKLKYQLWQKVVEWIWVNVAFLDPFSQWQKPFTVPSLPLRLQCLGKQWQLVPSARWLELPWFVQSIENGIKLFLYPRWSPKEDDAFIHTILYLYISIYIYIYICVFLYIYIYVSLHIYIYIFISICIFKYTYIYIYISVYSNIYICIYAYSCISIYVYIHIIM